MYKYLSNNSVTLRAPEPSDLDILYCWENNPALWCAGNSKMPLSRYVLEKYIETAHLDLYEARQLRLIITLTEQSERAVGAIDLFDFDPLDSKAGVGVLIADLNDRGKHYASESLSLLIDYAFKVLGIHQLYSHVSSNNVASLAVFKKLGFEEAGLLKHWTRWELHYEDQYILQLINPHHQF
jgi:diamine N-acetyltransferase